MTSSTPPTRPCVIVNEGRADEPATFHQLGNDIYHDDGNNPHSRTVAIVEDSNKQLRMLPPYRIRFTD